MAATRSTTLLAILGQLEPAHARRNAGELAAETDCQLGTVRIVLQRAETAGLVEADGTRFAATAKGRALLASAGGVRAPRRDLRQRLWTALRRMKKATVDELVTVAASGDEANARNNAQRYLPVLERAGYVRALPRRQGRAKVWLIVNDSGARAPMVCRGNTVSDPNTGEVCNV